MNYINQSGAKNKDIKIVKPPQISIIGDVLEKENNQLLCEISIIKGDQSAITFYYT